KVKVISVMAQKKLNLKFFLKIMASFLFIMVKN
ncbi:MAG: hypothetical protein ACI9VT_003326, partial [Psychroserpens sp.]